MTTNFEYDLSNEATGPSEAGNNSYVSTPSNSISSNILQNTELVEMTDDHRERVPLNLLGRIHVPYDPSGNTSLAVASYKAQPDRTTEKVASTTDKSRSNIIETYFRTLARRVMKINNWWEETNRKYHERGKEKQRHMMFLLGLHVLMKDPEQVLNLVSVNMCDDDVDDALPPYCLFFSPPFRRESFEYGLEQPEIKEMWLRDKRLRSLYIKYKESSLEVGP